MWQRQPLTAVLRNFLRVNAQIHNLDKQKTTPARITLGSICDAALTGTPDVAELNFFLVGVTEKLRGKNSTKI